MSHETVFGIAWEIGLDTEQLTTDMNTPSIQTMMNATGRSQGSCAYTARGGLSSAKNWSQARWI